MRASTRTLSYTSATYINVLGLNKTSAINLFYAVSFQNCLLRPADIITIANESHYSLTASEKVKDFIDTAVVC